MKIEIPTLLDQLVAAAANGICQGIIVTVLVALSLRGLGRTNAATRHAVWFCTLLLLVSILVVHGLIAPPRASQMQVVATVLKPGLDTSLSGPAVAQDMATWARMISPTSELFRNEAVASPEEPLEQYSEPRALSPREGVSPPAPRNLIGGLAYPPARPNEKERGAVASVIEPPVPARVSGESARLRWLAGRMVNPVSMNLSLGATVPRLAGMVFLALWLTIGSVRVFVLFLQLSRIRKLKHGSLPPSAGLNELFQKLTTGLAVKRKVKLRMSPTHRSSFLLGFLHPVILLPAEARMEPGEAELVLRHELAHLQRRDDWANLVQQFILAACFFHPAVWWVSKQLSLEREIACDDHVLRQSRRPQAYALLLANLAARMQRPLPLLAPGSSNHKTQLKQRIDMILNTHRNTSPRLAKTWLAVITSAAALSAVAITCSAPRIVLAQNETVPAAAKTPSADAAAGGSAAVAFAPDAPDSDSADAVPRAASAPATVGPGPKFKPGSPRALDVRPAVPAAQISAVAPGAAPAVVAAPAVAAVPTVAPTPAPLAAPAPPSLVYVAVQPGTEPEAPPPRPPRPVHTPRPGDRDSSLEERLERLEHMVESLMKQQSLHLKSANDGMIDRKEIAKSEAFAKLQAELSRNAMIDPKEIEKIKEAAEREAARAVDQARRAMAEVDKAAKAEQKRRTSRQIKEGSERQLEALRKQQERLEREREKVEQQIERLEQDQEQLDEQSDEEQSDSDQQPKESKAECVEQPSAAR